MSPRAPQQILRLPVGERIDLVQAIWDSVVAESGAVPVTAPQRRALDQRLADTKAKPRAERPWSAVRACLKRKT
jgi:putative addiction module component (TIGR02574 family)